MLQHFIECIKQAKSVRQQAVQMNIFTSVLCALKVGFKINEDKEYNYDASLTVNPSNILIVVLIKSSCAMK